MYDLCSRLKPLGRIMDLKEQGWTVWDCSAMYDDDGNVHVFSSRWPDNDLPDKTWFLGGSQIVHAVAPAPEGPYRVEDILISCDGGATNWDSAGVINPKIYRVGDGFCLIYTGCTARRKDGTPLLDDETAHSTQAIGMLSAPSFRGPWTRLSDHAPLIGVDYWANNPALLQHPNGQFWVYYKTPTGGRGHFGLAIADRLEGPYRNHPSFPLISSEAVEQYGKIEDPYVWYDEEGFWLLCNVVGTEPGPAGLLFHSEDGVAWDLPVAGYPNPADFRGLRQRLEEPNLLFRDDRPTHLFNVMGKCPEDPVYSGFVFEIER